MNKRLLSSLFLLFTILRSSDASSRAMMAQQPGSPSLSPAFSPIPLESKVLPPPLKQKRDEKPEASSGPSGSENVPMEEERCDASVLATCHADLSMVACIRHPKIDSKRLVLLVQNNGETTLSVVIKVPTTVETDTQNFKLTKHDIKKFNVSEDGTSNMKIVLNSGKDDCVLEIASSISGWNTLQPYSAHLTPTNGAYFLFAIFTIAAGTWACCKLCRKGRQADAGVPYQQLEMGMQTQQSGSAPVEADGWDQGWDDDWDGEEGTVRPTSSPNGNGSTNGLTSRSTNKKNGWDIDWDD